MPPGGRAARSLAAVLLGLFGVFVTMAGPAASALEGSGGPHAGVNASRIVAADPLGDPPEKPPHPRFQCQRGETPPEYLERPRAHAPAKREQATVRRAADTPEYVQPGGCLLRAPRMAPAEISQPAEGAAPRRSHRTFDGRAPPTS